MQQRHSKAKQSYPSCSLYRHITTSMAVLAASPSSTMPLERRTCGDETVFKIHVHGFIQWLRDIPCSLLLSFPNHVFQQQERSQDANVCNSPGPWSRTEIHFQVLGSSFSRNPLPTFPNYIPTASVISRPPPAPRNSEGAAAPLLPHLSKLFH